MRRWVALMLVVGVPVGRAAEVPEAVARPAEAGRRTEAVAAVRRATQDPGLREVWEAWAALVAGDPAPALGLVGRVGAGARAQAAARLVEGRARLLVHETDAARELVQPLLDGEHAVEARVIAAEASRIEGEAGAAREGFNKAIEIFNTRVRPGREERLAAARAGRLNRDPHGALRHLEVLQREHPWMTRARIEMGELFLQHYQTGDAATEFAEALKLRPDDPAIEAALAEAKLAEGLFDSAGRLARAALGRRSGEPRAHRVQARRAAWEEDWTTAEKHARAARAAAPGDPAYLALLAEVLEGAGRKDEAAAAAAACLAINPHYAELDEALGEAASGKQRFEEALAHFTRGIARDPRAAGCLFQRGVLHLRGGRLPEAREDLEKARYLDPFLVPAVNYLKVLDRMEGFAHFAFPGGYLALAPGAPSRAHPLFEKVLGELLVELSAGLGHRLDFPARIEVFDDVTWFNARAKGLGGDDFKGVSFGACLSFCSAEVGRDDIPWRRTFLHELVHSFNRSRVGDGLLPRWFTEGLAVELEGPRHEGWMGILVGAWQTGELVPLAKLPEAFGRSDQVGLAYMQAGAAIRWITTRAGPGAVDRMLLAYRDRVEPWEALVRVMGRPLDALEADYKAFLEQLAAAWPGEPAHLSMPEGLARRAKQGDREARREAARVHMILGRLDDAEALLAGDPDPRAAVLAARVRVQKGKAGSRAELEAAARNVPPSYGILMDLVVARLRERDAAGAEEALEKAHALHPGGRDAAFALFRRHRSANRFEAAAQVLDALLAVEPDQLAALVERARLASGARRWEEAERFLEAAVEADATRPGLFLDLARLRRRRGDGPGARQAYAIFAGVARAELDRSAPAGSPATGPVPADSLGPEPPGARRRSAGSLVEELVAEEDPELALAGLVDGLGLELEERGEALDPEARAVLQEALHGRFGRRGAHAAAIALGLEGDARAAGFLLAARACSYEGPMGQGRCGARSEAALAALAVRPPGELEPWWRDQGLKGPEDWFRAALEAKGYPPAPAEADGEAKLLTIVLEDPDWFRARGAWIRLRRSLGGRGGRGALGPGLDPVLAPIRREAVACFTRILKERRVAARTGVSP